MRFLVYMFLTLIKMAANSLKALYKKKKKKKKKEEEEEEEEGG